MINQIKLSILKLQHGVFWAYGREENTFSMVIHLAENEQKDYI